VKFRFLKKVYYIVPLCLGISGCESVNAREVPLPHYKYIIKSWIGAPLSKLRRKWGEPAEEGHRYIIYRVGDLERKITYCTYLFRYNRQGYITYGRAHGNRCPQTRADVHD